jgi:4'-phosphopantetheinyl transferase
VYVWLIRCRLPTPEVAALVRILDAEERLRAAALAAERRRRFVVAHAATRAIIGEHLGVPPERLRWRRGPHGKPELTGEHTGVRVNLSHSGDLAAVALTARRAIGVDVQELRASDVGRLAERFFPPAEARFVAAARGPAARTARFTQLWTRKEACVKVAGGRLMQGMLLRVRAPRRGGVLVRDPALPEPCLVRDVPVPEGFRAAVALAGEEPFRITRWWWRG